MQKDTGSPKQTKETARLAKRIRRLKSQGKTFPAISRELGLLTEDGRPDPGLVYKIGYEEYEPKSKELRDRLGLRKICLACMRPIRKAVRAVSCLPPWRAWWNRLGPAERDRRIRDHWEEESRR